MPLALVFGQQDDSVRQGAGLGVDLLHHDGLGAVHGQDVSGELGEAAAIAGWAGNSWSRE